MPLPRWTGYIQDETGAPVSEPTITVREESPGLPLVQLYEDRDGMVALGNPFTGGTDGKVSFCPEESGLYRIEAEKGAFSASLEEVAIGTARELDSAEVEGKLDKTENLNDLDDPAEAADNIGALTQGKRGFFVPASAMVPRATAGPQVVIYDSGANDRTIPALAFDQSSAELCHFIWSPPPSWKHDTGISFRAIWTHTAGSAAQVVVWALGIRALSDGDDIDGAAGTNQGVSDAAQGANKLHRSAEATAVVPGNTPADGDLLHFQFWRNATDGGDTLAADAILFGVELFVELDDPNDETA